MFILCGFLYRFVESRVYRCNIYCKSSSQTLKTKQITTHCTTPFDMYVFNMFSNNTDNNIVSGLLMNDISDHIPVFVMYSCEYVKAIEDRRVRREEAVSALRNE